MLFLLCCALPCIAARLPVDWSVQAGYDNVVAHGPAVVPVVVTIDNNIAGTRGLIEISQPDVANPAATEVRYVLPFVTPAPSKKKFEMLVRVDGARPLELAIHFEEHLRNVRQNIDVSVSRTPIVLCLDVPRVLRVDVSDESYRFVSFAEKDMPTDPVVLDGISSVFASGRALGKLTEAQLTALRAWGMTGGTLVLCEIGTDAVSTSTLEALTSTALLHLRRAGVSPWGAGRIAVLTAGSKEPIQKTVFPKQEPEEGHYFGSFGGETGYLTTLWRARRSYSVGAFLGILSIMVLYVSVVGPLDWFVIRKLKRPYMTWAFFCGAIVAFSFLAYAYSNVINVGSMRAVTVDLLDTAIDSDVVRGNSQLWLYSARNATYTLTPGREQVCFSAREGLRGVGNMAGVQITNGRTSSLRSRIPIFSSKIFDATWYADWVHKIQFERQSKGVVVRVPKTLRVRKGYLATETGLTELVLRSEDDKMREYRASDAGNRKWKNVLTGLVTSQDWDISPLHWFLDRGKPLLPPQKTLDDYCLSISFAGTRNTGPNAENNSMFAYRRNRRERALEVQDRLSRGDILLLLVEDGEALLPVTIQNHRPDSARVSLVRIQVPTNM
jgi:hypothetical protein